MIRTNRMLTFAAGTALAALTVSGCTTKAAPRADFSAGKAQVALQRGNVTAAIAHAEAAVLAEPRNAAYRGMLGAAYMEAGRFLSARTSFDDAMELGDESARTALGFALAAIATGDNGAALEVLEDWRDDIPAGDLGLAYALAGNTAQGVQILSNAVRSGDETPKTRQNLAYGLALNGNWAAARIMAAQDVPSDQLERRLGEWAALASADASPARVAALLGTRAVADGGQPAQLALANNPSNEQLAAEAAAPVPPVAEPSPAATFAASTGGELPALASASSESAPVALAPVQPAAELAVATPVEAAQGDFQAAFAAPVPAAPTPVAMMEAAVAFASQPVVQQLPARTAASESVRSHERRVASRSIDDHSAAAATGTHLVQLGSFSSEASARRAWAIYSKRFPQLSGFDMVITRAVVRGKNYFRVSAGGMQRAEASSLCSVARSKGQGCHAWAEGRPMKGAVSAPELRMAAR